MTRFKLIIEYDGRGFVGWQRQANGLAVQEVLEDAAAAFCGAPITAHGAGRTDAGVHALAMAAHIDIEKPLSARVVKEALNAHLRGHAISVLRAEVVDEDFHARFSCIGRDYEYRIINRRAPLTLDDGHAWPVKATLDAQAMHAAAQCLVGRHDFTTFRAVQCQAKSPIKSVDALSVARDGEEVFIRCSARSFLHHQVRSFVGSLVEVGRKKWGADDLAKALAAKDRSACGPVAPPDGLYFVRARYENNP